LLIKVAIELLILLVEIPLDDSPIAPTDAPDLLSDSSIFRVPSHLRKHWAEVFDHHDRRISLNAVCDAFRIDAHHPPPISYTCRLRHRRKNAACKENPL